MSKAGIAVAVITFWLGPSGWSQEAVRSSVPVETGFLIVDGRCVDAPYVFRQEKDVLYVNAIEIDEADINYGNAAPVGNGAGFGWRRSNGSGQYGGPAEFSGRSSVRAPWRQIVRILDAGGTVVVLSGQKPIALDPTSEGYELLTILCGDATQRQAAARQLEWLRKKAVDKQLWYTWIADFEPTESFLTRARTEIDRISTVEQTNTAASQALRRLEVSAYPLTLAGMLLVVLAAGHLLQYRPEDRLAGSQSGAVSSETNRMICRSLLLIFLLSGLDLIWTVLVSQTGSMKELNPLGSRLIDQPHYLVLFKLAATLLAVGLLYATRRTLFAQQATWWMCLVCTLLAIRWLTFQSMNIA